MQRRSLTPRANWQAAVEEYGLIWHSDADGPYWDESACYAFSMTEIETIEAATEEVHRLYRAAGDRIANDPALLALCGIPDSYHPVVRAAWQSQVPALDYGRFDFAWDGSGAPKLLEFNCDTPTAMLETSIVQWYWKEEVFPAADQLNSLHEQLIARWQDIAPALPGRRVWFTHFGDAAHEDTITTTYMRDLAAQAEFAALRVPHALELERREPVQLGGQAEFGASTDGRPQHVAGGDLRDAVVRADLGSLRALARPRRAQQDQSHRHPRSVSGPQPGSAGGLPETGRMHRIRAVASAIHVGSRLPRAPFAQLSCTRALSGHEPGVPQARVADP